MDLRITLGDPKTGHSFKKEVKDDAAKPFLGMKIGDSIKGELIDMPGYEFLITGGSDIAGFPMRNDVHGTGRRKILMVKGVGLRPSRPGMKKRKSVSGNTIAEHTAQLNLKITKYGKDPLPEPVKKEKKKEE
ncbi:MAG: 30S ribosomal protein S6e [archaeon]